MTHAAWTAACADEAHRVLRASLDEDLGERGDITSHLVLRAHPAGHINDAMRAHVVAREAGSFAGTEVARMACDMVGASWQWVARDGATVDRGELVGVIDGAGLAVLSMERTLLNLLGVLCGTATVTRRFVDAVGGTRAVVCDTRKTLPGLRRLQKFSVVCGGGTPHRVGLHDAVLIKDNHIVGLAPHEYARVVASIAPDARAAGVAFIEAEVDRLDQLDALLTLPAGTVDIVLLDNFALADLEAAVARRDACGARVLLEASGGVTLDRVRAIAEAGVDRISVGALTHSVRALDLGLDAIP